MNATYRLTDRGKRLYWLYRAFDERHRELTPDEFIQLLTTEHVIWGKCLGCPDEYVMLIAAGLFCVSCCRATYERG